MPRPKHRVDVPARFPEEIGIALVCPDCRSAVVRDEERFVCTNARCRRLYAIEDGIPRFLISDSVVLDEIDWRQIVPDAH